LTSVHDVGDASEDHALFDGGSDDYACAGIHAAAVFNYGDHANCALTIAPVRFSLIYQSTAGRLTVNRPLGVVSERLRRAE
jgi:hypothetical protein